MQTSDFVNISTYTTGREEQRINPTSLHKSHAIVRTLEGIEQVYINTAYSANRKNDTNNLRNIKKIARQQLYNLQ
jgi:hypothetical protein